MSGIHTGMTNTLQIDPYRESLDPGKAESIRL